MEYYYCNPTGNITILVKESVPVEKQPVISNYLCEIEPTCEQVGFIYRNEKDCDIRLRMAGGEFCGNATMSTAALFCDENGLEIGSSQNVTVKVSGAKDPLSVTIKRLGAKEFSGRVEMPLPKEMIVRKFTFDEVTYELPVVIVEGMYHIIYPGILRRYIAEKAIKCWCEEMNAPAMGIMMIDEKKEFLTPLVYVKNVDSLYWEHSCGSGTAAAGFYYYKKLGTAVTKHFYEPSGILTIEVNSEGKLYLSGQVSIEPVRST